MTGWNLPPGVTDRMIDEQAGGYDEEPERCPICGDRDCEDPHEQPDPPLPGTWNDAITGLQILWREIMRSGDPHTFGTRSPADRVREMISKLAILRDGGDPDKERF